MRLTFGWGGAALLLSGVTTRWSPPAQNLTLTEVAPKRTTGTHARFSRLFTVLTWQLQRNAISGRDSNRSESNCGLPETRATLVAAGTELSEKFMPQFSRNTFRNYEKTKRQRAVFVTGKLWNPSRWQIS